MEHHDDTDPGATPSRRGPRLVGPVVLGAAAVVLATVVVMAVRGDDGPGATGSDRPAATAVPVPPGWRLSFHDEFAGDEVSADRWHVYDDAAGDEVESPKASTCPLPGNVEVADGVLTMTVRRERGGCRRGQPHSGAGLSTVDRFEQAGGRFEARLRWTHRGHDLWGGFWTHGNTGPDWRREDPSEIDVFEYIGRTGPPNIDRYKPAIHFDYSCSGPCGSLSVPVRPHDVTRWHRYAVEWEPAEPGDAASMEIRFLLDDRVVVVFDREGSWRIDGQGRRHRERAGAWGNAAAPFPHPFGLDRPQVLLLSAWAGAPGLDAATVAADFDPPGGRAALEVDWVRVFERSG